MKKSYLLFSSVLFLLTLSSCDQSFNPKADYHEKYVLNCILCGDTLYQAAVLSHSYDVNGFDPYVNTTDPAITGADLRLWYNDTVYIFRDSVVTRLGNSRYDDSLRIYYLNNIHIDYDKPIEIEALLPNGKRLKSSTTSALPIVFDLPNSEKLIPPINSNLVAVKWDQSQNDIEFYLPKFQVTYYKNVNGQQEMHTIEIPIRYNLDNGEYIPVYPIASNHTSIAYDPDDIKRALLSISEGDPQKNNYSIPINNSLKVYGLDANLARYYSANRQENNFTVRLDENDYSNIDGGFGVFGSYIVSTYILKFNPGFITDLGYNVVTQ